MSEIIVHVAPLETNSTIFVIRDGRLEYTEYHPTETIGEHVAGVAAIDTKITNVKLTGVISYCDKIKEDIEDFYSLYKMHNDNKDIKVEIVE